MPEEGVDTTTVQSTEIVEPTLAEQQAAHADSWYAGVEGVEMSDKDMEYGSLGDYIKGTQELRGMISKKGLIKPGDDASLEDKAAFRDALGDEYKSLEVPAVDGYDVQALTDNEALTDERRAGIAEKFNSIGLSNDMANGVMELFGEQMALDAEMIGEFNQTSRKETETALKEEWGADYTERLAAADLISQEHPELMAKLEKVGMSGDMDVLNFLDYMARSQSEDTLSNTEVTRASAKDDLSSFMASKEWKDATAWNSGMSAGDPRYDAIIAKRDRLIELSNK